MDITDYFKQKKKIEEENTQLLNNIEVLTSSFEDYYYYTVNKRVELNLNKVTCTLNIYAYIPLPNKESYFKFNFPVKLEFGNYNSMALHNFSGFGCNAVKERDKSNKIALFLMYPEIKYEDVVSDMSYSLIRNVVYKEKKSMGDISFADFMRSIPQELLKHIQDIEFKDIAGGFKKKLTEKEKLVISNKFTALIARLVSDFENDKPEGFQIQELLDNKRKLELKMLHQNLSDNLEYSIYQKGKKI